MTEDTHLDLDALHATVVGLSLLAASDTRTLENDGKVGSYIHSAYRALGDAANYLREARQYEQDAYEALEGKRL